MISLSVLVPNYNYGRYIADAIHSVLSQADDSVEIVVSDNASTDESVDVVRSIDDARIRVTTNPCNVGFAANLERVAAMAHGRRMLLLSSDDRMRPGALQAYARLEHALGPEAERAVWGAVTTTIDPAGKQTGIMHTDPKLWLGATPEPILTKAVGHPVRSMRADVMLKRSLLLLRSPLAFATTCYSRTLHDEVGGYSGGRLINPDKWFLWKLLSVADKVLMIDDPLFDYRVHDSGQGPQEQRSGALKHLTDEYVATFAIAEFALDRAGVTREELAEAFIEQDVALRGLLAVARGQRSAARRRLHFGIATYPAILRRNPKVWALRGLLALGPLGSVLARSVERRAIARWARQQSERPNDPPP